MDKFVELLRESVLVQGIITLVLVGVACYLLIVGRPVPELLASMLMLVLGFYFGTKSQQTIERFKK